MAIEKGINSYVTLAEAADFFENRVDVAAWVAASDSIKGQALVTATGILDTLNWTGVVVSESQSLAFPRIGFYFDPKLGYEIYLPETVPNRIIIATYELAYHLLNNDGLLDDTGTVHNLSISTISIDIKSTANLIPASVKRHINPLLQNNNNVWWRAN
jgi:hypothetical protein